MLHKTENLIRTDFASFVRKAFYYDHDGKKLGSEPYIDYLCFELDKVAKGETKRQVINLPPRHLKTFLAAIYLPAWVLAKDPSSRIMVITYSDQLAEHITYQIRRVLQSPWFKKVFKTRVAEDRSKMSDFATTQGGGVFATSVGGALAGRGADIIIFDDPLDLKDAGNVRQIELVNQRFNSLIMSRLNDPKTGRIVIIAHRLNDNDLSAHVRKQGDWRHIVLPLIATRKKSYDLGYDKWLRKRGELLRPGSYTAKKLTQLQMNTVNPDFELLYQQDRGGGARMTLRAENFGTIDTRTMPVLPVILSIDPGQRAGVNNSYGVIQAWSPFENKHILLEQWREQCNYPGLKRAYWLFVRKFRPSVALIEATANGPALISEAKRKAILQVVEIMPDSRSKAARLLAHVPLTRRGGVQLTEAAAWSADYVKEFVDFPLAPFDDQIDATTQYLDWVTANPVPPPLPQRAIASGVGSNGLPLTTNRSFVVGSIPGDVAIRRWR
jgi:predicted phage terminase large subunit-like protein